MKKLAWYLLASVIVIVCFFSIVSALESSKAIVSNGHSNVVSAIAISPDGKLLASGSWDHTVRLWDMTTGREIRIFRGHSGNVDSLAFSTDGKRLLSGGQAIKIWDIKTGKEIKTIDQKTSHATTIQFSPDRKHALFNGTENKLTLLDIDSGKQKILEGKIDNSTYSIAFSPDGKYAVSGSWDRKVRLWSIEQGKMIGEFTGHSSQIDAVDFSPDGRFILSGSADSVVILWEIRTRKIVHKLTGFSRQISCVKFAPDGKSFLTGTWDKQIQRWDTFKGTQIRTYLGHTKGVIALNFLGGGARFVSGSADYTMKIWDANNGKVIKKFPGQLTYLRTIAISSDGKYLVTTGGQDFRINIWDRENSKYLKSLIGHWDEVSSVAFSPDNRFLVSGSFDKTARLWNITTGKAEKVFQHDSIVTPVGFINQGQQIITGSSEIRLWDVKNVAMLKKIDFESVSSWCSSPDQRYLVTGHHTGVLVLWSLPAFKPIRAMFEVEGKPYSQSLTNINAEEFSLFADPDDSIAAVTVSHHGKYIAAGSYRSWIRIWDLNTGRLLNQFTGAGVIGALQFSPDDQSIIVGTGNADNSSVKVYDLITGKIQYTLVEKTLPIGGLAFSGKGNYLISAGWDGILHLWDYPKYKEIASFFRFIDDDWLITTPQGFYNGSFGAKQYLYLNQNNLLTPIDNSYQKRYFRQKLSLEASNNLSLQTKNEEAFPNVPETVFIEATKPKIGEDGRLIVYEMVNDIDLDGLKEKFVLDVDRSIDEGVFSRLRIYNLTDDTQDLVFDSVKAGIDIVGDYFTDTPDLIRIADNDQNGIPEIYIQEWAFGSTPSRIAIIEKVQGKYAVLFYNHLDDFKYRDFNNDGKLELYGFTTMGEVPYVAAQSEVYTRQNDQYIRSDEFTYQLIEEYIKLSQEEFRKNPTFYSAQDLIGLFILLGDREKFRQYLKENLDLFKKAYKNTSFDSEEKIDAFVNGFSFKK